MTEVMVIWKSARQKAAAESVGGLDQQNLRSKINALSSSPSISKRMEFITSVGRILKMNKSCKKTDKTSFKQE